MADGDEDDDDSSEKRVYDFYDFTREVHRGSYISASTVFRPRQKSRWNALNQRQQPGAFD